MPIFRRFRFLIHGHWAYTSMGQAFAGMGVALGDMSNDGMLDLFVTHLNTETNTLWKQGPRGFFRDKSLQMGLTAPNLRSTGFGTAAADFDHDGFLDIAIANGHVARTGVAKETALEFWEPYAERNTLLANTGSGQFRDVSSANRDFCGYWNVGRGLLCADFDNDGAMDVLVTSIGGRARLFRNVAPNRGHWLKVRAILPKENRDAYGAEVRVSGGKKEWLRSINPAGSFLTSGDPIGHFGLGALERIDSILVTWPDGNRERFPGGAVDRVVEVRRGKGSAP